MKISDYVRDAAKADRLPKTGRMGKISPTLGLAGEIGSLLTELKKEVRDPKSGNGDAENRRAATRVKEELGDILWYSTAIAKRAGLRFQKHVLHQNLERISQNLGPGKKIPSHLDKGALDQLAKDLKSQGEKIAGTFSAYQSRAVLTSKYSDNREALLRYLVQIWKNSGDLIEKLDLAKAVFSKEEKKIVSKVLGDVMWYVAGFANLYSLDLDTVAKENLSKVRSLFPTQKQRRYTRHFDGGYGPLEKLPRIFTVEFQSVPKSKEVVMLINGVRVGDRLTDNAYEVTNGTTGEIEGYRFHDCIHLAFVAVLGWSPVMRALMKLKRKSNKEVDNVEDGARAQIVEEMIVKLAHSYAVETDREALLDNKNRVSVDLLKQVVALTSGLEVAGGSSGTSGCKYWEWEQAILRGFKVYNYLRRNGGGRVHVNMNSRRISYRRF